MNKITKRQFEKLLIDIPTMDNQAIMEFNKKIKGQFIKKQLPWNWKEKLSTTDNYINAFYRLRLFDEMGKINEADRVSNMFSTVAMYEKIAERSESLAKSLQEKELSKEERDSLIDELQSSVSKIISEEEKMDIEEIESETGTVKTTESALGKPDTKSEADLKKALPKVPTEPLGANVPKGNVSEVAEGVSAEGAAMSGMLSNINLGTVGAIAGIGILGGLAAEVVSELVSPQNVFNIRATATVKKDVNKPQKEPVRRLVEARPNQPKRKILHARSSVSIGK